MLLTSLPPPSQRHWFYRLFYEKEDDLSSLTALYQLDRNENIGNLPTRYYESQLPLLATQDQIDRRLGYEDDDEAS